MKRKIQELILKWIYETGMLSFTSWKSPLLFEQYLSIHFGNTEIDRIIWTDNELINRRNK